MFGPQARAAELQAVRSAAMRQKSHESEQGVLGPAAVSLTDFARAQPASRNKGSKQYKPLILEALLDGPDDNRTTDSAHQSGELEPASPSDAAGIQHSSVLTAPKPAPVAPKAMMLTTTSTGPSPAKRPQLQTPYHAAPASHRVSSAGRWSTRPSRMNPTPTHGGTMAFDHARLPPLHPVDFVYGLEGYSPAKPELQIEHLRDYRPQRDPYKLRHPTQPDRYHAGLMPIPMPVSMPMPTAPGSHHLFPYDHNHAAPPFLPPFHLPGRLPAHEDLYSAPHLERSHTFASDILEHESSLQENRAAGGQGQDPPYDRNTRMQNFVAAQQAMAKTGKTVLHNPELHKVVSSSPQSQSSGLRWYPAATPSRPGWGPDQDGRVDEVAESGGGHQLHDPAEMYATWENGGPEFSPSRGRSDSSCDPFASGFTPQPRQRTWMDEMNPGERVLTPQLPSQVRRRRPMECAVIWRAMQAAAYRSGSSIMTEHLRDPTTVVSGPTEHEVTVTHPGVCADDNLAQLDTFCMLHPLSWCKSVKYDGVKGSSKPPLALPDTCQFTSFPATIGALSREWLLRSTEDESAMQEDVIALVQDHEAERLHIHSAVGVIGQRDGPREVGMRPGLAVGVAKALMTVQQHHKDHEQAQDPRRRTLSYQDQL